MSKYKVTKAYERIWIVRARSPREAIDKTDRPHDEEVEEYYVSVQLIKRKKKSKIEEGE